MSTHITAVFEAGVFRPTAPVSLEEGTQVEVVLPSTASRQPTASESAKILAEIAALPMEPGPRLPDYVPGEEISAPFDLPRSSQPVPVKAVRGEKRLPDPVFIQIPE